MVHIAYCKLPSESVWNQVASHVHTIQLPGTKKFYHWQDQCRFWLGRYLLASLLDSVNYEFIPGKIRTTEYGRPYINHCVDFNISHSGDIVIAAITTLGSIGIDIEQVIEININDVRYTLSVDQYLQVSNDQTPPTMFYKIWTMKESVVKLMGSGIGIPLQHISSDFITAHFENRKFFVTELKIADNYSCFISTDYPVSEYTLCEKNIDSLKIK